MADTDLKYVNKRLCIAINKMCIDITGGTGLTGNNLRDGQGLGFIDNIFHNESFGQQIYPNIYHQAGAYLFYIVKNHLFHDGNKRTGLACAITFLQLNDVLFDPFDEDEVFDFIVSVAGGPNDPDIAIPQAAAWLEVLSIR
jgi:death-on-curing protein